MRTVREVARFRPQQRVEAAAGWEEAAAAAAAMAGSRSAGRPPARGEAPWGPRPAAWPVAVEGNRGKAAAAAAAAAGCVCNGGRG